MAKELRKEKEGEKKSGILLKLAASHSSSLKLQRSFAEEQQIPIRYRNWYVERLWEHHGKC